MPLPSDLTSLGHPFALGVWPCDGVWSLAGTVLRTARRTIDFCSEEGRVSTFRVPLRYTIGCCESLTPVILLKRRRQQGGILRFFPSDRTPARCSATAQNLARRLTG